MRSGLNAHHQNGEFSTGWSSCAIIVEHLPGDGHLIAFELEVPEERRCVGVPLRVVASAPELFSCGWRRAGGRTFPSAVDCEDGRVLVVLDDGNDARIACGTSFLGLLLQNSCVGMVYIGAQISRDIMSAPP